MGRGRVEPCWCVVAGTVQSMWLLGKGDRSATVGVEEHQELSGASPGAWGAGEGWGEHLHCAQIQIIRSKTPLEAGVTEV